MAGTASTVRSWLLLEHPGPWGRDALAHARLPPGVGPELRDRCRAARVRPLLIRRHVGGGDGSITCFAIRSGPGQPWIERAGLDRIEDALELDLRALGGGDRLGLEPVDGALFLVCTHGRHDRCCAEHGRPLAGALARAFPGQTWEATHVGGDRFAANVVALPHGYYFGRVEPDDAERVGRAYLDGRIPLDHLRGRSCTSMPVQAAEHALRTARGLDRIDDVVLERIARTDRDVRVTFRTPAGPADVWIRVEDGEPRFLTCSSGAEEPVPTYQVLSVG